MSGEHEDEDEFDSRSLLKNLFCDLALSLPLVGGTPLKSNAMEEKKIGKLRVEGSRKNFFLMGVVSALSLTLIAFEWKTDYQITTDEYTLEVNVWEGDLPPIPTYRKKAVALPEPSPKTPSMTPDQGFEVIDNFKKVQTGLSKRSQDPGDLGEVDIFEGLEDDPWEDEGFIQVDPGVLDDPIDAKETMPTFCACEGIENAVEREACNNRLLYDYLGDNLRYPRQELDMGQEGTAFVQYVVSRRGIVEQIKVGTNSEGFMKEAKRVVSNLPCIRPAYQNGHTVAVRYVIPIHFKIH